MQGRNDTAAILTEARARLSKDEKALVRRIAAEFERGLIEALPEMLAGVRASGKQSSFTETVSLKKAKGANLHVGIEPRVRTGREQIRFEAHITETNQLSLGWIEAEDESDEDPEIGAGRTIGFDDAIEDGAFEH